ncbi:vegetative incompatibility protein HET-E-1 [Penicillium cosmopolitanum]|uniref:Vegetative incompatibility protein HET-E-1 n=1 Tax=Penicillium cosmopolitanum TaxID=1131564 RepID=A0A9W9VCT9_9EURO|nr:vegetative incompatibility protein HET-E-1 [Penicillium cosmopolitanum]KAJ5376029.1 vegetative incompatibility protein HET-E-1 [Penicillium cosmopolitanum]
MDGLASNSRLRFWVAVTATTTVVILTVYLLRIRPIIRRISRRRKSDRLDGLHVISEPENAEDVTFEIVAVHGLGADSEHTWTAAAVESPDSKKKDHRRVHLLKDLLKNDFPHARISAFAHNSDWLIDAPVTTAQQIGHRLLDDLVHHRSKHRVRTAESQKHDEANR